MYSVWHGEIQHARVTTASTDNRQKWQHPPIFLCQETKHWPTTCSQIKCSATSIVTEIANTGQRLGLNNLTLL